MQRPPRLSDTARGIRAHRALPHPDTERLLSACQAVSAPQADDFAPLRDAVAHHRIRQSNGNIGVYMQGLDDHGIDLLARLLREHAELQKDAERLDRLPLTMGLVARKYDWLKGTPDLSRAALDLAWQDLPKFTRNAFAAARSTPAPGEQT